MKRKYALKMVNYLLGLTTKKKKKKKPICVRQQTFMFVRIVKALLRILELQSQWELQVFGLRFPAEKSFNSHR